MLIRRSTIALLLLAQGLGLMHLALETHAEGSSGEQLDVSRLHDDAHRTREPHVCAPESDASFAQPVTDCPVLAVFQTPALISPVTFVARVTPEFSPVRSRSTFETPPQDVLSRAPKSSPPAA